MCEARGSPGQRLPAQREFREAQAVKLLLGMLPPGPWGPFPAAEQRTVPAPAAAWQQVRGATAVGQPWRGVRGMQGCAMPSGRGPRLPDRGGQMLPSAASRCAFHSDLIRYLL